MTMPGPLFEAPRQAPWLAPYWEGLGVGELRLPRCSVCGRWEWYPVESGPACPDGHYVWEAVGPLATVFTCTRVDRPLLPGITQSYMTGLIVTDRAPDCRIAALFDESAGPVSIGARVRLSISGAGESAFPYFTLESMS
ncbi:hypothetical protein HHL26_16395 [Sphingobium sp. TB-6]|uniref:Zn-ribbon domain-containing OB-fold protein n=1 Tax=Sphingobium sp. TB-6 TaxID=2728850 RepID=UPI00146D9CCA|nr:hypothetical protein [Sphingobium sp. TB-6]NML90630.1 hypothetical protein [Sphingobium sp. TB-6]